MPDRSISLNLTISYSAWVTGLVMIVVAMVTDAPTSELGLWITGVGGVLSIRHYLCGLERREVNAFELGRDFAAGHAEDARVARLPSQR